MKKLIFILLVLRSAFVFAQETPPAGVKAVNGQFYIYIDNTKSPADTAIWHFKGSPYGWERLARYKDLASATGTFTADLTNNTAVTFGKYAPGQTIPATGKTFQAVMTDILTQVIHPTYVAPVANINNSNPMQGTYEIGSTINNISLSSAFVQNDGGTVISTTYYRNGSALSGGTDNISSLTSTVSYSVAYTYNAGACKTNNLGQQDCTGQIQAGTATSGSISFTPSPKRYWGRCAGTVPTNAEILAAAGGGSEFSSSKLKSGITITASGSNRPFFAYISTAGTIAKILDVNGFDVTSDWQQTSQSFTNALGYTFTINIATLNNPTASSYTFSVTQ